MPTLGPNISAHRFFPDMRFVAVNSKYSLISHIIEFGIFIEAHKPLPECSGHNKTLSLTKVQPIEGWERTLAPPPSTSSNTNISENLHIKPQNIINVGLLCQISWTEVNIYVLKTIILMVVSEIWKHAKMLILLTKRTKIPYQLVKIVRKNLFYYQSSFFITYLKA